MCSVLLGLASDFGWLVKRIVVGKLASDLLSLINYGYLTISSGL